MEDKDPEVVREEEESSFLGVRGDLGLEGDFGSESEGRLSSN